MPSNHAPFTDYCGGIFKMASSNPGGKRMNGTETAYEVFLRLLNQWVPAADPHATPCMVIGKQRGHLNLRGPDGKNLSGPRIALSKKLGRPVAGNLEACHHCDNPPCFNPDHLYEGTHKENMEDMANRNRSNKGLSFVDKTAFRRGSCHPQAIVSEEIVLQIRREHAELGIGCRRAARKWGLSKATAQAIIDRTAWSHI
jgi:hypothetical protein